jgi:excisionase family DNA binding protein
MRSSGSFRHRPGRKLASRRLGVMSEITTESTRRPCFTTDTLAEHLHVSDRLIRRWVAEGRLPSYKLDGCRRFDLADVDDFVARPRSGGGMSRRRPVGRARHNRPYRRTYDDGRAVWVARYRDLTGAQRYAKPRWNGEISTFLRKADAQLAIDEALEAERFSGDRPQKIGEYFEGGWLDRHPRSERTNKTYTDRIACVLDVAIEGAPFRDWLFDELRRRHVHQLLDHLLRVQRRSAEGARGILRSLSAMSKDAIGEDAAQNNPFMGIRLRRSDPRIQKPPRQIRIWTFEQMREFAAAGRPEVRARTCRPPDRRSKAAYKVTEGRFYSERDYEALLLTPAPTGLRLGEFLALRRRDYADGLLDFEFSSHDGKLVASSDQKNHDRAVPVPASLAVLYDRILELDGDDDDPLFKTATGRRWSERNFYRDVWTPAKVATGMDPTPHEFRHSYITLLRAAGIDDADLAQIAGHRIETMISIYTHPLGRSHQAIRDVLG